MEPRPIYGIGRTTQLIPPNPDHLYFDHSAHPFKPHIGSFQMLTAWWLAEAATLIYNEGSVVKKAFESAGFRGCEIIQHKTSNTDCCVAYNERDVIIAFRGTEFISFEEWRDNFNFQPKPWAGGGKAHTGFQQALESIWKNSDLARTLADLRDETPVPRNFWFTGHSLGAAIATLAADRFYHESNRKEDFIGLYTFGSPRVGDKLFQDNFPIKTAYRFVNNRDSVPDVPPKGLFFHVGHLKYIDRKGNIHEKNPGNWFRLKDRLLGPFAGRKEDENRRYRLTFWVYLFLEPMIDHAPLLYANRIWNFMCNHPEARAVQFY